MEKRGTPHRLVDVIRARPGEFEPAAHNALMDNPRRAPKRRLTHLDLICEICGTEATIHATTAGAEARRFDQHPCRPKAEWPERERPAPRVSPGQVSADRERRRGAG